MQEFIHAGIIAEESRKTPDYSPAHVTTFETEQELQQKIQNLEQQVANKDYLIEDLQVTVELRDKALYQYQYSEEYARAGSTGVSKGLFAFILVIAFGLAGLSAYTTFIKPTIKIDADTAAQVNERSSSLVDSAVPPVKKPVKKPRNRLKKSTTIPVKNSRSGQVDRSRHDTGKDSIQVKGGAGK